MSVQYTLEQLEEITSHLPTDQQLRLAAHICDQLSRKSLPTISDHTTKRSQVNAYLAECDAIAAEIGGDFDSGEELRSIREERAAQLG